MSGIWYTTITPLQDRINLEIFSHPNEVNHDMKEHADKLMDLIENNKVRVEIQNKEGDFSFFRLSFQRV